MKNLIIKVLLSIVVFLPLSIHAQESKIPKSAPTSPTVSALEIAVLAEINEARTNPQKYIGYLEDLKKSMKGSVMYSPNSPGIVTIEGAAAIDEAIADMKKIVKLEPMAQSNGLTLAAQSHLAEMIVNPKLGHRSANGDLPDERLARFGYADGNIAENICYLTKTARSVVLTWIIDDNYKSRTHRKNVLYPSFKLFGTACGTANEGTDICVADFAESFADKN